MDREKRLEQLLRKAGKVNIPEPNGVGARTVQRLISSPPSPKESKRLTFVRGIGGIAAACLLLVAGFFAAQGTLNWWPAHQGVDIASDARVVELQEQLPFPLALPTWLPRGYELRDIRLDSEPDPVVRMEFTGPKGAEPIIITQAYTMELLVHDLAGLYLLRIDSPERDWWIGSNDTGWGPGTRADTGYYCEGKVNQSVVERTLVFIAPDPGAGQHTYVTVHSGTPVNQSRSPGEIASAHEFTAIAQGMAGAEVELISLSQNPAENWPLVMPASLPPGYTLSSMYLTGSLLGAPHYQGNLVYATDDARRIIHIRQTQTQQFPEDPVGAEEVPLSTAHLPLTGHYREEGSVKLLSFCIDADWVNCFDVLTDSAGVEKDLLLELAQSLAGQYRRLPAPTRELYTFSLLPTSHSLTFGPGEDIFVAYVPANGEIAELWVGGVRHELPGVPLLSDYGPVRWRGERFVYHVASCWDEEPGIFYIYDIRDHSYIGIEARADWGPGLKEPVFLDDDTIAVLAPGGVWSRDLRGGNWKLMWPLEHQDIQEVAWSPDARQVAFVAGGDKEQLMVLDLDTGREQLVYSAAVREEILELAWSSDSRRLAAVTTDIGLVWDGTGLADLKDNAFTRGLSWVPGQDIISYTEKNSLTLVRETDGAWHGTQTFLGEYGNYAWLPNGNLAVVDLYSGDVTVYGWK
ncbi:MAG: hypothetical protein ACOX2G_06475 [Bacillota bacterium]|jgi:hypothetical protein